ncbi:MAG: FecR domain-containing protein [Phycisphaerae bacterium]|nr:FecR domain-containing protein [Phycisphaerae bacterium]
MVRYGKAIALIIIFPAVASCLQAADTPAGLKTKAKSTATTRPAQAAAPADGALRATVVSVKGTAQKRLAGDDQAPWKPIRVGEVLTERTLVRTGLGAKLVLRFSDRGEVTVKSAAKIGIRDCRKEGDVARMGVGLKYGTVKAKVNRAAGPNDFRIHTPVATLSVRGSAGTTSYSAGFGMQFHSQQSTWNVQTSLGANGVPQGASTDGNLTPTQELAARKHDSKLSDPFGVGGNEAKNVRDNGNPVDPFNPIGGTYGVGMSSHSGLGSSINRSDVPIPIPPGPHSHMKSSGD